MKKSFHPVLFASLLALAPAQTLQEGLAATLQSLPSSAGQVLQLPQGLVAFDGTALTLTPPGQPTQTLLQLPTFAFGSFTIDAGAGRVLFGESSNQRLWLVALTGPPPAAPLATLTFNYDAAPLDAQRVLVSAKTTGGPNNDLVLVHLATGALQPVASLPGASGPVAVAADGDVYYATASAAFPPPVGGSSLLRIRRTVLDAAIASQTVLTTAQTELVLAGFTAPGDLAFDDDGDLWITDFQQRTVREVNDVATNPSLAAVAVAYPVGAASAATLQFVAGNSNGVLEPFQPGNGRMLVFETDFFSTSQLRTLTSAQAATALSGPSLIPSGPFALLTVQGPRLGLGLLAIAAGNPAGVAPLAIPGFEAPLWWSPTLVAAPVVLTVGFDANGAATLALSNPGFPGGLPGIAQVAFVTGQNGLGAAPPVAFTLGQ